VSDDQGDLFGDEAKRARDRALEQVTLNGGDWQDRALQTMSLMRGFVGTAEDIRLKLIMVEGMEPPHHHNAWGALIKEARKRGRIQHTGQRRCMRTKRSHGRETPVYVVK